MASIEVDFDVFKELTVRRKTEATTYNDVIRELLKLPPINSANAKAPSARTQGWVSKGIMFPNGTEFRATYKGKTYTATVKDNQLLMNGKAMTSPSEAATAITNNSVNGWTFWECQLPHEVVWRRIDSLRAAQ